MTQGYGSAPYGTAPFGGPPVALNLLTAVPPSAKVVDLTFSEDVSPLPIVQDVASYGIPGLSLVGAVQVSPRTVRLYTSSQTAGVRYTVTVSSAFEDTTGAPIVGTQAQFLGLGPGDAYTVSGLTARTDCRGKGIYLAWKNPVSPSVPQKLLLVRRLRAWPFDLTDAYDTVYEGAPLEGWMDSGVGMPLTTLASPAVVGATSMTVTSATGFTSAMAVRVETVNALREYDTPVITRVSGAVLSLDRPLTHAYAAGARVARSLPLLPQTYYYYRVLVSTLSSPAPRDYDIRDETRTFALSIDEYESKDSFFWAESPVEYKKKDLASTADGGGAGFLDQFYSVMGCWLNLLRGYANAIQLLGDDSKAPYPALRAKNLSLGFEPEGEAYDYDIPRRSLLSLAYIFKRKGTCPGIVEVVRMLTTWDATCVDLSQNTCANGAVALQTWDGESLYETRTALASAVPQTRNGSAGSVTFTDTAQTWEPSVWAKGSVRSALGDVLCLDDNTNTTLTTSAPRAIATVTGASGTVITLSSVAAVLPHMTLEFQFASGIPAIAEVLSVNAGANQVTLRAALPATPPNGSTVSIQKSVLRTEYGPVTSGCTASGHVLTDGAAAFVENQWKGYQIICSDNVVRTVTSNTGTTLTCNGTNLPATPSYAIAYQYAGGSTFASRLPVEKYHVMNGTHATLLDPVLDVRDIGSLYDPFSRTWQGPNSTLLGAWGPSDVGVYILSSVVLGSGRASICVGAVFTLDPASPPPDVNALVGDFLNPNQNQEQLFEIVSNTATTVTLTGDVTSLLEPGQFYYVLSPRDTLRFRRLLVRLKDEFTDSDSRPRVLFF